MADLYRVNIRIEVVNNDGSAIDDAPTPSLVDSVSNLNAEQTVKYTYAAKALLGAVYIKAWEEIDAAGDSGVNSAIRACSS